MSYEQEQLHLQKLMQELLSDEENSLFGDVYLSDEYQIESDDCSDSDSSSTSTSFRKSKRIKLKATKSSDLDIFQPSTSSTLISTKNANTLAKKPSTTIHVTETIEDVIAQFRVDESSSEDDDSLPTSDPTWGPVQGNHLKDFPFTEPNPGIKSEIYERFYDKTPYDFYKLMLPDYIISHIVLETNRYTEQCKRNNNLRMSRIKAWADTNSEEIERFLE
ncbi:uncharacterized protein [Leptinotarsa decemlineata]|uniref:uncharacterized protein n=1 Tax=Leptinotarsa decemlineata TaxID=7539 RepID=UPI003D30D5B5